MNRTYLNKCLNKCLNNCLNKCLKLFCLFILVQGTTSCGWLSKSQHKKKQPFVHSVEAKEQPKVEQPKSDQTSLSDADRELLRRNAELASRKVAGEVVLKKSAIFNQVFLYGADLQYSSFNDPSWGSYPQALAIGHVPSFFRQVNHRLQLIADQSRLFESDINKPETLICEYEIVHETDEELTVNFEHGSIVLNHFMNGDSAPAPKQTWLRSIAYDQSRNVLLQESAIMTADGVVQTFMESLFPRDSLIPQDYKGLEANSTVEPLADRYRFITGERVYVDRVSDGRTYREQTAFASRYLVNEDGYIDWYVTPNVPAEFLPAIKSGIEGWNRYFSQHNGRDVVRFRGVIPEGVKLGDPSYNIVNWDSVADAGSAYESQAIDPLTGIQSHSLIYMPFAWYNLGVALWSKRHLDSEIKPLNANALAKIINPKAPKVLMGRDEMLACVRTAEGLAAPIQSLLNQSQMIQGLSHDEFGKRLVATVLFHEIGHALGLDHNFKGSLSFDGALPIDANNPSSFSSMDYNYYQLEMGFFDELGAATGPILEYDRQIISQLYNNGKDVKESDPVVAVCNDAEADDVTGGVDPTCLRYDSQRDPVLSVEHAWGNFAHQSGAAGGEQQTLAEVLHEMKEGLTSASRFFEPNNAGLSGDERALNLAWKVNSLTRYFIASGAQSLATNLAINSVQLRQWKSEIITGIPAQQEERNRIRYMIVLNQALELADLPNAPSKALNELADSLEQVVYAQLFMMSDDHERKRLAAKSRQLFMEKVVYEVESSLSALRRAAHAAMIFEKNNAFALKFSAQGGLTYFEDYAVETMAKGALKGLRTLSAGRRSQDVELFFDERFNAAKTLKSFAGETTKIEEVTLKLKDLAAEAKSSGDLELLKACRELVAILSN